jgi:hypothetical protein
MKNNINKILEKRFQTTMIGSLYEFEESFGYLWGQDKEDHELTEQEQKFRTKWEDTRNEILNNGNNQLRKCINDLSNINTNDTKYSYKFYNRKGWDR